VNRRAAAIAVAFVLSLSGAVAQAQEARLTPDQQREFLRTARIINSRPIGKGVTESLRVTLSDGKVTHDAAFQSIDDRASDEDRRQLRKRAGELNFVDSYKYNIAAYEIARLLGIGHMMPVTVRRSYGGRNGSLTWWVDNVLMDEAEREKTNTQPPTPLTFTRERMTMIVFGELVGDVDRNKGNVLYTTDWRVVMIDFTRGFRLHPDLRVPQQLTMIDRNLWQQLQRLTLEDIRKTVDDYLTGPEIRAVMQRQKALVDHYSTLIKERGEASVLY
jgi:hypothetical protein